MWKKCFCFLIVLFSSLSLFAFPLYLRRVVVGDIIVGEKEAQLVFREKNTNYVLKSCIDLQGGSLYLPAKAKISFCGGSIRNGNIYFNKTLLKDANFEQMLSYNGNILNKDFDLSNYGSVNDDSLLRFIFSQLQNNSNVYFESRKYLVKSYDNMQVPLQDSCYIRVRNITNIHIHGKGATISDDIDQGHLGRRLFNFLCFESCKNVVIESLSYQPNSLPDLGDYVKGVNFLRILGECSSFTINIKTKNCARGVYAGSWNNVSGHPKKGLCNSSLNIFAQYVGYPIQIEKGTNLNIVNKFDMVHRGTYLAGVTNSKVYVEGKNVVTTKIHLLLTDTMDADGWYYCDNIDATVIDTGTDVNDLAKMVFCQIYSQDYTQFAGRPPYNVKNLSFHVYTPADSNTSYEIFDIRDNAQVGDRICATIDGELKHKGTNDRLFRILNLTKGEIVFNNLDAAHNTIAYTGDFPDDCHLVLNNCSNVYFDWGSQQRPTDGLIEFNNCTFINKPTRFDKSKTGNYVRVKSN
ncbi:MAG: hypothetical protein IJ557_07725 [Bacteroidaceae bacterium]|nr:hypothetical protein [Bacteroidaceae bacterium]